jgi:uncharacterized protein YdeI (BOF family)
VLAILLTGVNGTIPVILEKYIKKRKKRKEKYIKKKGETEIMVDLEAEIWNRVKI